jgi:NADH:ubiquinone oxidoreductase subunit E
MHVPMSRALGAVTFYPFFVCTGTACYLKGAPNASLTLKSRRKSIS